MAITRDDILAVLSKVTLPLSALVTDTREFPARSAAPLIVKPTAPSPSSAASTTEHVHSVLVPEAGVSTSAFVASTVATVISQVGKLMASLATIVSVTVQRL